MPDTPQISSPAGTDQPQPVPDDRARVIAALAYVPTCCFLPYFVLPHDDFARAHGRQAFVLIFCAVVVGLAVRMLEWAFGALPVLDAVVQVLARLLFAVGLVLISGLGALRALTGERVTHHLLAGFADRLRF